MSLPLHPPFDAPPTLEAVGPASASMAQLPRPLTRIIGREADVENVRQYLLSGSTRVVTLVGSGGVGKSRLSLEVANEVQHLFRDGVVFVALATVRAASLVLPAIARALGLKDIANHLPDNTLHHALRDRELLLVLDNFEQVVGAAVDVANIIALCPKIRVLVTSRRPLGIRGEQQVPVFPLPLPDDRQVQDLSSLPNIAAITLFVERVRSVVPYFTLTAANAVAIAGICSRLDGLPLAIELVAARCKLLSPQTLLARLSHNTGGNALDLLTHGSSDLPDRQQTLRQTIGWSYELLDPEAQQLFAWLGCFAGSWTLEAACAVAYEPESNTVINSGDKDLDIPASFLDLVSVLLDNHLIHEIVSKGAERRFAMLETIREYALEQLMRRGELTVARQRHAAYYCSLADAGRPDMRRGGQAAHFDRLELERPNIRAALEWFLENDLEKSVELVSALWWFWYLRSYWAEGYDWLRRALELVPSLAPSSTATSAMTGAGALAWVLADFTEAHRWCALSLSICRSLDDQRGAAYALMFLGMTVLRQGNYRSACSLLEESVTHFHTVGDLWGRAHGLNVLRQALVAVGDLETARVRQQESVNLWRGLGDTWGLALALNGLAEIARSQGDMVQAVPLYEESLSLFHGSSDKGNAAIVLHNLAHAILGRGAPNEAKHLFLQALQLDYGAGRIKGVVECLAGLGAVAVAQEQWQRAALLLGYVQAHFSVTGIALCPVDQAAYTRAEMILALHVTAHDGAAAKHQATSMSLDQTVAYASSIT